MSQRNLQEQRRTLILVLSRIKKKRRSVRDVGAVREPPLREGSTFRLLEALALLAVLLLGFGLRVFRLDGQSFWSDEGASVFMTGRSFGEILQAAAGDIHPPLYYLFLHYWSAPVGTSEFAVRFLSVVFGLLLVVLVFRLGRRLAGRDVGLVAAFLAATSPLLIYYSQEARMYMQMAFFATLSVVLAMEIWKRVEGGGWRVEWTDPSLPQPSTLHPLPYVLVTVACLYTQYFSFTIVLFENVAFVLLFWRFWRCRRAWATWIAAQLAVVLLYLPWLGQVAGQLNTWTPVGDGLSLWDLVHRVFLVFSFGLSWDMTATGKTELLFGVLLVAGALLGWRVEGGGLRGRESRDEGRESGVGSRKSSDESRETEAGGPRPRAASSPSSSPTSNSSTLYPPPSPLNSPPSTLHPLPLILAYLAIPIAIMFYMSLSRPIYNPKFLLLAMPPFFIVLAMGVTGIRDLVVSAVRRLAGAVPRLSFLVWASAAAVVLLLLGGATYSTSRSLAAYYFDPKYARDDYRGLSRYIELSGRPGDAIILNAPGQVEIFGYYYKGSLPVLPLPRQRPIDEQATEADLKEAASKYRRIWVVFWAERESDPGGFIERWLNQNTFRASNKWYGSARLVLYSVPAATSAGTIQQQVDANLGNKVFLLGYSLNVGDGGKAIERSTGPGEVLQLTLFWQALAKMEERFVVFTHLIDRHEHIWGQRDAEPGSGARPTTTWAPEAIVSDNFGIPVVFGTPPGEYYVEIGLYLPLTGQRLQFLGQDGEVKGDRVLFGPVVVAKPDAPPAIENLSIERSLSADFGPLRLLGYELYKLGTERGNLDFRRGDIARLALYWQALQRPGRDLNVVLRLLDQDGRIVFTKQNGPADGNYPSGQWEKGEIVLDQHKLPLDLPPGKYRLVLGLDDGRGPIGAQGAVSKGQGEYVGLQAFDIK